MGITKFFLTPIGYTIYKAVTSEETKQKQDSESHPTKKASEFSFVESVSSLLEPKTKKVKNRFPRCRDAARIAKLIQKAKSSDDSWVRARAVKELENNYSFRRAYVKSVLINALNDPSEEVRAHAVHVVSDVDKPEALSALIEIMTNDKSESVRAEAVSEIEQIYRLSKARKTKLQYKDVITYLTWISTNDESSYVREQAVRAIEDVERFKQEPGGVCSHLGYAWSMMKDELEHVELEHVGKKKHHDIDYSPYRLPFGGFAPERYGFGLGPFSPFPPIDSLKLYAEGADQTQKSHDEEH